MPRSFAEEGAPTTGDAKRQPQGELDLPEPDQGDRSSPSPERLRLSLHATAERISALGGQIAVGDQRLLKVSRPDGDAERILGGSPETEGATAALQPTWSHDGLQLVWNSLAPNLQAIAFQDFDDEGAPDGPPFPVEAPGPPFYYFQWDSEDRRLATLRESRQGGEVAFGVIADRGPHLPIAQAAPFFLSWAPESPRLATHLGERELWLLEPDLRPGPVGTASQPIGGAFSAPAWLDESTVLIANEGSLGSIGIDQELPGGEFLPLVAAPEPVSFVLSPDRARVAYQGESDAAGSLTVGLTQPAPNERGLLVLNLETSEIDLIAPDGAVAWEWSPDGQRLAYLVPSLGRSERFEWRFWSTDPHLVGTPATQPFGLTAKMSSTYLPFFAQFAQSVSGWSPDSTAFAYAGRGGSENQIYVQLVDVPAFALPVTPGDFVTWGRGPTPPPTAAGISPA